MQNNNLLNRFVDSHLFIYILSFAAGCSIYSLKLISIIKLLEELSFEFFPGLMLIQGIVIFFSTNIFKSISKRSETLFFVLAVLTGAMTVYLGNFKVIKNITTSQDATILYSCIVFLLSTISLLALESTVKLINVKKVSVLRNPNISTLLVLMEELGIFFSALLYILFGEFLAGHGSYNLIPISVICIMVFLLAFFDFQEKGTVRTTYHKIDGDQNNKEKYKFVPLFIGVFCFVGLTKSFQGFATLIGINEFVAASENNLTNIFSKIAIHPNYGYTLYFNRVII